MAAATTVPIEKYLSTTYRPDCDYIDGDLIERNVGERDHSWMQGELLFWLRSRAKELRIVPLPEQRLQVGTSRFCVPDIMVLDESAPYEPIVQQAPILCIEILSPEDTLKRIMLRIEDYLQVGVLACWIIDPTDHLAWIADSSGLHPVKDGVLRAGCIQLPLTDIWPA
jgi:Uma2 family endonuclease